MTGGRLSRTRGGNNPTETYLTGVGRSACFNDLAGGVGLVKGDFGLASSDDIRVISFFIASNSSLYIRSRISRSLARASSSTCRSNAKRFANHTMITFPTTPAVKASRRDNHTEQIHALPPRLVYP